MNCPCGSQLIHCKGLCKNCYWKQWRKLNPEKVKAQNRRREYSAFSMESIPDPLETFCNAFNLEPLELARYILELRSRQPRMLKASA